ncbi:MAG: selenide, water dikinase SelD [Acetivibrio sp.]
MKKSNVALTSLVKTSGCAAKIGPGVLHGVLEKLPKFENPNLIIGFDTSDDACVYKINEDTVAIQTVDFFPPMVDDPYTFGQIAAANALSDVYAMGGNPATAMNLMCFPSCLDIEIMQSILEGGYSKVAEAGAVIAGGHTISDPTPKYGLCVTGFAHPKEILTNSNAKVGDVLILTKPIGLGIMNTAAKAELLSQEQINKISTIMTTLNKYGKECMKDLSVHSCTDVTGFSLTGHSFEMADGSHTTIELYTQDIPKIEEALDFASMGIIPEGMYNNLDYLSDKFTCKNTLPQNLKDLLLDPQTSGGLLISLPEKDAKEFLSRMEQYSPWSRIIGQVVERKETPILFY